MNVYFSPEVYNSILGPLLILIFINDITVVRFTQIRLFAYDTCMFLTVDNRQQAQEMIDADLQALYTWSNQWLVKFSVPKTKSRLIGVGLSGSHKEQQTHSGDVI